MSGDDDGCWVAALVGFVVGMFVGMLVVGVLAYLAIVWSTSVER